MDNVQLSAAIRNNLPAPCVQQFLGCLTVDQLAELNIPYKHDPLYIIVNILPTSKIELMGHWVLVYIENRVIYFFDSFAMHPKNYSPYFTRFLLKHEGFDLWLMERQLQSASSHTCGAYVLYFMHVICTKGLQALRTILKKDFKHSSGLQNDRFILLYVYKYFPWLHFNCQETFCRNRYKHCVFYLCKNLP